MKVLFIGNSFSADTTQYLQEVSEGKLFVRNLYIGGCSLEMHAENIRCASEAYEYQIDAAPVEKISINEALLREEWDVISVQQVSGLSGIVESYEPYLGYVVDFVRSKCPKAKIVFNRTWAYEMGSSHPDFVKYECDTNLMFERILCASSTMAEKYSLDIIPVGNAISVARLLTEFNSRGGGVPITRDGFHLSFDCGRYLAALVAYAFLTGESAVGVEFVPTGVSSRVAKKLKIIADAAVH